MYITFRKALFTLLFLPLVIQAQTFNWAIAEGGIGVDVGKAISFDGDDNVFTCGDVAGSPSFRNVVKVGNGLSDAFIAKYDQSGNIAWVKLVGGTGVDRAADCAIDQNGNSYLTGHFENTINIDGKSVTSSGGKDIFLAKFDASGNTVWIKSFGKANQSEQPYAIAVSGDGHIYLSGNFVQSIQFGNNTLTSNNPYQESFLVKFDLNGNMVWAKNSVAGNTNTTNGITVLPDNSIAVTGYFSLSMKWDTLTANATTTDFEIFLAKFTKDGNLVWLKSGGSSYEDGANSIANDPSGNIFITGYFAGAGKFDNQSTGHSGYNDAFVAKFDNSGTCQWLRRGEGLSLDVSNGVACDVYGNVYATGFYDSAITFSGRKILGPGRQIFIVSYDANGDIRWLKDAGESGTDCALGINVDRNNSVYITGFYLYKSKYDNILLPLPEAEDIFLAKLIQASVGLNDIEEDKIVAYPNPAQNLIVIEKGAEYDIRILNSVGQTVLASYKGNSTIDVSSLSNGFYFIQANDIAQPKLFPIVIAR